MSLTRPSDVALRAERPLSDAMNSVVAAAERAGLPFGTDAGPFSRAGLNATAVLGVKVPQQMVAFYHQQRDTPEVLMVEPLLNVLKLALEWVRKGGD